MSCLRVELEELVRRTPKRVSGNDIIKALIGRINFRCDGAGEELISTMSCWLAKRSEPLTMYAVELIGHFKLSELEDNLVLLLDQIQRGEVFDPYYKAWVVESLDRIKSC